ncbi:hypothetical protein OUY22_36165 [Nonomuraea sp. MCN248]|uniref:Late embryogenesis abundant protein LEA-2 subgroup domain-containing protein n=1 Tax=Nonomuraea corallina TaxID=2989783 RepID=A0ABT4SNP6_9ACTN|nr:hypothetical protein [Nonomuraea corallina]MDA0638878.1 hypothetical protein [Nonomuraea corallina]
MWERLDHGAGRATRSEIRRMRAALVALVAAVPLALAAAASGLAVPRLGVDGGDPEPAIVRDDAGRVRNMTVWFRHRIVNDGWFPVTVSGVGLRADGVRLTEVRADDGRAFPLTIRPGGLVRVRLLAQIVDCERALAAVPELSLRAERWWGSQSAGPERRGNAGWEFGIESACDR